MKTTFKTVSLADQVFERLEDDIITGVYPRGTVLTELKLAETLQVSRTPIREALRRLEQERLIAESGKGSVVLGITRADLLDIMSIRERIEGLAAYYAAINLTEDGERELSEITRLQDFYFQHDEFEKLREMDDRFHDAIYELCGRTVIRDTLLPLHRKTGRYRRISIGSGHRHVLSVAEHREIAEAIIARDGDRAAALMTQHILNAKISMIEKVPDDE